MGQIHIRMLWLDDDGSLGYVPEEQYTEELWDEQKKSAQRNIGTGIYK